MLTKDTENIIANCTAVSGMDLFHLFNGKTTRVNSDAFMYANGTVASGTYIGYSFPTPVLIDKVVVYDSTDNYYFNYTVEGLDETGDWVSIGTYKSTHLSGNAVQTHEVGCNLSNAFSAIRTRCTGGGNSYLHQAGSHSMAVTEIVVYGSLAL